MESKKNDCPRLLEDILFEEILPRLELEFLIRFKLVSKRWLHLITTDSCFISNHYRRHSEPPAELSIIRPRRSDNMFVFDHRSGTTGARNVFSSCVDRFPGSYSSLELVGSCDGLVCVAAKDDRYDEDDRETAVLLWNPATGEARDTLAPPVPDYRDPVYGFGYDERHRDYKVVRIRSEEVVNDGHVPPPQMLNFYVFSRNSGEWRRLDRNLVGRGLSRSTGISVNGCLYWCLVGMEPLCILAFDLCSDEFRVIDTGTPFVFSPLQCDGKLVKWKHNCVAYVMQPRFEFEFVVVLDGDGNVAVDHGIKRVTSCTYHNSLYGVSHGRFFVEQFDPRSRCCYTKFMTYDLDGDRASLLSISAHWGNNGRGLDTNGELHDYVPTLVSVYPHRDITMMMEGGR